MGDTSPNDERTFVRPPCELANNGGVLSRVQSSSQVKWPTKVKSVRPGYQACLGD